MRPPAGEYPFGRARTSFQLRAEEFDSAYGGAPPVLAYGANGSPEMLAHKLPGVPVLAVAGVLHDHAVVYSAHVSPYGSVPATIVAAPGERAEVHAIFLPDDAIEALDATEPNYDRVRVRGARLVLDAGDAPTDQEPMAYVSRHGPLLVDGEHIPLGSRPQDDLLALVKAA